MKKIELGKIIKTFLVRIEREDKIIENLENFANSNLKSQDGKYRFAEFKGIGGGIKNYKGYFSQVGANVEEYAGPAELLNITGNITNLNDKPFVHAHVAFGDRENEDSDKSHRASGFHLVEGEVGLTIELIITEYDKVVERSRDHEGLPLILSSAGTLEKESSVNETALEEENKKLKKEIDRLKKENEKLKKQLEQSSTSSSSEQVRRLNEALEKANKTNEQLIAQIQIPQK